MDLMNKATKHVPSNNILPNRPSAAANPNNLNRLYHPYPMIPQFHFSNISDKIKEKIQEYAAKRFEHLDTFLSTFQDDNKQLKIDIGYHERHSAFELNVTLQLAGKKLHHREIKHDPMESLDLAESNITKQAKKFIDKLRTSKKDEKIKNSDASIDEETTVNFDNI